MGPVRVRIASEADIPAMRRIRMSVRENRLDDPGRIRPHHYREMLTGRSRGWVAEAGGGVVGFAVADLRRARIWALFVDPGAQGGGIGRRLHDVMVEWLFAEPGVERIWLTTEPGTRAERFYLAAGWRSAGPAPRGDVRLELSRADWPARDAEPPGS